MAVTPDPIEVGASEHGRDERKKDVTCECVDDLDGRCDGLETEDTEIHSSIKDALGGLEADLRYEIESFYSEIAK
ncbi:hypothetical protein PanWU01x14_323710, partial [Parasponia andersonii]